MNYLEWATKLFEYYFNEDNNGQEVILYCDDEILNEIGGENGKDDFLNLFLNENLFHKPIQGNFTESIKTLSDICLNINLLQKQDSISLANGDRRLTLTFDNINKNPKYYFPFIILMIYAYVVDGIFTQENEIRRVGEGREQEIRKQIYEFLNKLSVFLKSKNLGYISLTNNLPTNIYGIYKGVHMYSGCIKYHAPFTRQQISEIIKIKNRNGIYYEITDHSILENLFKDILTNRFNDENRKIGYKQINNVITGKYKLPTTQNNSLRDKNSTSKSTLYITPSLQIKNDGSIKCLLSIHSDDYLDSDIELNIDGNIQIISRKSGNLYNEINILNDWPINVSAIKLQVEYTYPSCTFYIPTSKNQLWSQFGISDFIASDCTELNCVNYLIKDKNDIIKIDNESNWHETTISELFITNNCTQKLHIQNGKIKESIQNTYESALILIDNNFYVKKHGDRISYLFYFLPVLEIKKQPNERCFYEYNNQKEVEICSDQFDLNLINGIEGGKILKVYIKGEDNEIIVEKKIELLLERDQVEIQNIHENLTIPKMQAFALKNEFENIEILSNNYLARILYSLSGYDFKRFQLTKKNIFKIIDEICLKLEKKHFLEQYIEKQRIVRDLLALGYIIEIKNNFGSFIEYQTRELALVQVNQVTILSQEENYNLIFRLSGARNLPFIKELIQIAKQNKVRIELRQPKSNEIYDTLMPHEIYFLFKNIEHLDSFLKQTISQKQIKDFVKIVPFNPESKIDKLTKNCEENAIISGELDINNLDKNILLQLIDGQEVTFFKEKNIYNQYWILKNQKYYKAKSRELASVFVYSENKTPFLFSKFQGNAQGDTQTLYISIVNNQMILPQEYYTELVYLNGGLPHIKTYDNSSFVYFNNIKRDIREQLSKQLNTEIAIFRF